MELLVSLTILGIMVSAISGAFHLGTRCFERADRIVEDTQDRIYGWDQIAKQVRSAFPYKSKKGTVYLEGEADSLDFVSAYSLRWGGTRGLVRASYKILELDEGGYVIDVYEEQLLDKDQLDEKIDDENYETLARSNEELSFRYYKQSKGSDDPEAGKWMDAWDQNETSLPARIALVVGDADPDEDVTAVMQMSVQAQTMVSSTGGRPGIQKGSFSGRRPSSSKQDSGHGNPREP
ncbi:MAG: hypothetical protein HY788_05420 [Deltaproteobacteria bacterium]|nr:hypothetical protein [Deltaproteobacteria bacterium]